jgi:hypothetical protein
MNGHGQVGISQRDPCFFYDNIIGQVRADHRKQQPTTIIPVEVYLEFLSKVASLNWLMVSLVKAETFGERKGLK